MRPPQRELGGLPSMPAMMLAVWLLTGASLIPHPILAETPNDAASVELQAQTRRWIAELGADQFARRERAQSELRRIGVAAFDELIDAQQHTDIEIALRARYLVRSMPIRWTASGDPAEVKSLLRNYSETERSDRRSRMHQLANLSDSQGLAALCRLVRYETDNLLSKEAALLAIQHAEPDNADRRALLADTIDGAIGGSRRDGANWMRAYALTLRDPSASLDRWEQITRAEEATLAEFPHETHRDLVRDLLRWQVDLLRQLDRQAEALVVVRRTLSLVEGRRSELLDVVDWALERAAWTIVDEVAERFQEKFYQDPDLLYRLAEAQRNRGDLQKATDTAQQALALNPGSLERHVEVAIQLMLRQQYDWSEQELRFAIEESESENRLTLEARYVLADMLFDIERYKDAANAMKGAIDVMDDNPKLVQLAPRPIANFRGQMHYYYARHFESIGDRAQQIEQLKQAIAYVPYRQPDYIIAMYQVPDPDDAWREKTQDHLQKSVKMLQDKINRIEAVLRNPRNAVEQDQAGHEAAQAYNEFAWLVSNTDGDLRYALRCSKKSVELDPTSAAYLDTLARCYYAVGDLESAIKYQRMAVDHGPYFQQIRRQLESFERELAERTQS